MLTILIDNPDPTYLSISTPVDPLLRKQAIMDRLWANYLDNVWGQMKLGLMNEELSATYMSLIEQVVTSHPGVAAQMMAPNFTQSLREHVTEVVERLSRQTNDCVAPRNSDLASPDAT